MMVPTTASYLSVPVKGMDTVYISNKIMWNKQPDLDLITGFGPR